jgi:hypothetical protein
LYPTILTAAPSTPSQFELASPFLITVLIILISAFLVPEIVKRLDEHYGEGWKEDERKSVNPDRTPETHARAAVWAIDTAQIPTMIGTPAASVFILYKSFPPPFLVGYTAIILGSVVVCVAFRQWVPPLWYARVGLSLKHFRISLLMLSGIALNLIAAGIAAFIID